MNSDKLKIFFIIMLCASCILVYLSLSHEIQQLDRKFNSIENLTISLEKKNDDLENIFVNMTRDIYAIKNKLKSYEYILNQKDDELNDLRNKLNLYKSKVYNKQFIIINSTILNKNSIEWFPLMDYIYRYWQCKINLANICNSNLVDDKEINVYFNDDVSYNDKSLLIKINLSTKMIRLYKLDSNYSTSAITKYFYIDKSDNIILQVLPDENYGLSLYIKDSDGNILWKSSDNILSLMPNFLTHIGFRSNCEDYFGNNSCINVTISKVEGTPIFTLAQITDTHCGQGENTENTNSSISWIKRYPIDLVVHTGDLVQTWNNVSQWNNIHRIMHRLNDTHQWMVLAGNHDVKGGNPVNYTYFTKTFGEKIRGAKQWGTFLILTFSWESEGTLSEDTFNWVNKTVSKYPNHIPIICSHWLYSNSSEGHKYISNPDMERFLSITQINKNQIYFLSGHNYENDEKIHVLQNKPIGLIVSDSTGESSNVRVLDFYNNGEVRVRTRDVKRKRWLDSQEFWIEPNKLQSYQEIKEDAIYEVFSLDNKIYVRSLENNKIVSSGCDAREQIQYALDNLTPGRTWMERVVLKGNFSINASGENTDPSIDLLGYTILELDGSLIHVNCSEPTNPLIGNDDYHLGNDHIKLVGGNYRGNNNSHYIIKFKGSKNRIKNITITDVEVISKCNDSDGITVEHVDNFTISNCYLHGNGEEAIEVIGCKYGKVTNNWIDGFGHGANPQIDIWCNLNKKISSYNITVNRNTCENSQESYSIFIVGSKISINENYINNDVNHGVYSIPQDEIPSIENISIFNNLIIGTEESVRCGIIITGLEDNKIKNVMITNNIILDYPKGIYLEHVKSYNLNENKILNAKIAEIVENNCLN